MAITDTDARMTLEDAKVYLQDKTEFMKFDEAVAIVRAAGETDFLAGLGLESDAQVKSERQNRAATYLPIARTGEDYEGLYKIGEALDSQEIMIEADETFQRYAEANHIEINKDDQVTMQIRRMNHDIKNYDLETLEQDPETKRLMDSANVVDEENDFAPVSAADKKKLFEGLLEAAKNQTITDRAAEDDLFKMSEDKRRQEIRDSIRSTFQNKMLVAIGASNDMHLTEKKNKKSFSFEKYAKGVISYLADVVSSGKKVDVHKGQLLNSMADTQIEMEKRAKLYRELGMVNAANAIDKQKTGFVSKMKGWFGKAYEQRHAIAENMKNNKYKYIALGLAGVTVAVATPLATAGWAAGIAASYAGFIGTGSVVWPLVEKREAMLRQAKKEKNDALVAQIQKEGLVKNLTNIYNSMEGEEKKRYWQRVGVNTAAGAIGATLIATPALFAAKGALTGVALVKSKFLASSLRILGNLGVQAKFTVEDHLQAKKDQTEESRKKAKMSKWSLLITAATAVVSEIIGGAHAYLSDNEAPTSSGGKPDGLLDQQQGKGGKGGEVLEQKPAAPKAPTAEELAAKAAAEEAAAKAAEVQKFWEGYQVPTSYEEVTDSDVSKSDWNFVQKNLVGVYATTQGAEHFGTTAADSQATFDEALRNVATYMHEHPEAGEGKSPLKVLSEVLRRHALSVQAHPDGDGHLVATFDGAWHYGDKSLDQNMNAWMAIICNGYKADIPEGTDLNAPLANLQRDLIDATRNGNGNRVIGIKCDQTAFARGRSGGSVQIQHDEPPAPKQVKLNDELTNEDKPRQVNLNEEIENKDVKHESTWEEERGTTMNGRNQHPNAIKPGNHVKTRGIEI